MSPRTRTARPLEPVPVFGRLQGRWGWAENPRRRRGFSGRVPWASLLIAAGALLIHALPGLAGRLEYDRPAIAGGEPWRLVTGHLTHWSGEHLAWDLLVFLVAGALWEQRVGWRRLASGVLASSLAISFAVWVLGPGMVVYRGLSGVDNALLVALAAGTFGAARASGRRALAWATAVASGAILCKVGYELATGATVFVDPAAGAFEPVPLAHVVGGVCGLALAWRRRRARSQAGRNSRTISTASRSHAAAC